MSGKTATVEYSVYSVKLTVKTIVIADILKVSK